MIKQGPKGWTTGEGPSRAAVIRKVMLGRDIRKVMLGRECKRPCGGHVSVKTLTRKRSNIQMRTLPGRFIYIGTICKSVLRCRAPQEMTWD